VKFLTKQKSILLIIVIIVLIGFAFGIIYLWKISQRHSGRGSIDFSCVNIEKHRIKGVSLSPLLEHGQEVEALMGYYDCNPLKRGEIIILKFKTRKEIFVKKLVAFPGDKLEFQENNALLNGKILKNSENKPYVFSKRSKKILSIPLNDGFIPEGRFLVLSETTSPSAFDSRRFGFVEKNHIIGKVRY